MKTRIFSRLWSAVFFVMTMILFLSCDKEKVEGIPDILFNPSVTYGSVTDQDGNTYRTVVIGNQEWMAENLRTKTYRSGDPIRHFLKIDLNYLKTGGYCCYENQMLYKETYGFLYNYYAVEDSLNLAPEGWHVATYEDWIELINFLGGPEEALPKIKEKGKGHWLANDGTNESGLTLLPGGYMYGWSTFWGESGEGFAELGSSGTWWTPGWSVLVSRESLEFHPIDIWSIPDPYAQSVRCVRDPH